jgi:UDP-glucuronate 4-epimerase
MRILITGAAGMIGYHLVRRLVGAGRELGAIDSFSAYYDVRLKADRAAALKTEFGVAIERIDINDRAAFQSYWRAFRPTHVVHLAAQAGIRYSLENPQAYVDSNLVGFAGILEACRESWPAHLLYASSSSVYGANRSFPLTETQSTDHPISLYAATKKANELMAHSYSHLFGIPATGLRFFTVYGEFGRPDMAAWKFIKAIDEGEEIELFNEGKMSRDFTYAGDAAKAIELLLDKPPASERLSAHTENLSPVAPHRVVNIAAGRPVTLEDCVRAIEAALGKTARVRLSPKAPGDVVDTWGDIALLEDLTGYRPSTDIGDGMKIYANWFRSYRKGR